MHSDSGLETPNGKSEVAGVRTVSALTVTGRSVVRLHAKTLIMQSVPFSECLLVWQRLCQQELSLISYLFPTADL